MGHASVQGAVYSNSGTLIPGTTVSVGCGGAGAIVVTTNVNGVFTTNLTVSSAAAVQSGGRVMCRFTEPAIGIARVQLDTSIGFSVSSLPVALQFVNLHEQ